MRNERIIIGILLTVLICFLLMIMVIPSKEKDCNRNIANQVEAFKQEAIKKNFSTRLYLRETNTGSVMYYLNPKWPEKVLTLFYNKAQCPDPVIGSRHWLWLEFDERVMTNIEQSELVYSRIGGVDS